MISYSPIFLWIEKKIVIDILLLCFEFSRVILEKNIKGMHL